VTARPALVWSAVGLALGAYAALAILSERGKSAVFDEIIHLPPGYAALKLGDHRMNPLHPPLARVIAAVPLLFLDVHVDPGDLAWRTARPWEWGKRFLYRWNDGDRLLFWGRLPIVALAMVLALAVFLWARRLWGLPAGLLALALCVLDPDVLAHGHLVTNDLPVVLFVFLAVVAFERMVERVTAGRLVAVALAVGAAFATKFSALALPPILVALAVVVAARPEPLAIAIGRRERMVVGFGRKIAALALALVAIAALALVVVWAAYGFHSALTPDPAVDAFLHSRDTPPASPVLRIAAALTRGRLLPEAWVWGFLNCFKSFASRPSFLLGRYSDTGWWYYFPVAIALKAPLPLLALVAAAAVLAFVRPAGRASWFVWLPPALFLALTMTQNINIGHRHVLALYPFLFVAASRVASMAWAARPAWPRVAVIALVSLQALSVLRVHPDYLAYFNEAAGGPSQGWRWLVDSNLDWGQDLPGLKRYMDAHGIRRVSLCYFGTADPGYYGIACDRLPGYQPPPPSSLTHAVHAGDVVAVSATHLQGLYLDPQMQPLMALFRARRPVATIGHSIFIYVADFEYRVPDPLPDQARAAQRAPGRLEESP